MRNSAPDHMYVLPELDINMVIEDLKPEDDGVWRSPEWE
jgi:hypothetical protein